MGSTTSRDGLHPRHKVGSAPRPPAQWAPAEGTVKFFVAGDIGQPGPRRRAVAEAMTALQRQWETRGETQASFIVGTGDQVYGEADESKFRCLESEVLEIAPPLPWVMALGNHDVKGDWAGWAWHRRRNGAEGRTGWRWICPAPCYSLDAVAPGLGGPVDLVVLNTNKLRGPFRLKPPAPGNYSPLVGSGPPCHPFYTATSRHWWREQKKSLEDHLVHGGPPASDGGRFRIVVGHHPSEYVEDSILEHRLPGVRYLLATFMRGGRKTRHHRWGLAHVLRRGADVYLCGHQHLMAHMRLRPAINRSAAECRCEYVIVGSSSKTEQDDDDFGLPSTDAAAAEDGGSSSDNGGDSPRQIGSPGSDSPCRRYASSWVSRRVGFAVVEACAERRQLCVRFYRVDGDGSAPTLEYSVRMPPDPGSGSATPPWPASPAR